MKGRTETTMTKATQVALIVRKRTQLLAKLRAEAKRQGVTALNAQHQFAFDMFLTRNAHGCSRAERVCSFV